MKGFVKILPNQTLLDIAIQECGTAEAVVDIALANGLSVTADIDAGTLLKIPLITKNDEILNYYKQHGIKPATANFDNSLSEIIEDGELPDELEQYFDDEFSNEFFNY